MKKLSGIIFGIFFTAIALANVLSYDQMSISPLTWKEVDLTYINSIDGKEYTEHANLLRPYSWIKHNHLDKVGATVHLTKKQLGIDTDVKVIAIRSTKLDYSKHNQKNIKPVIAAFITHSNDDIWNYTFKDQYGHKEIIQAVSGHLFYSLDRQEFIPIRQFEIGEHIKTNNNNKIFLTSKYQNVNKIKKIYNFEVYQTHKYFIGNSLRILVHNPQTYTCGNHNPPYSTTKRSSYEAHMRSEANKRDFSCPVCKFATNHKFNLNSHMKTPKHIRNMQKHLSNIAATPGANAVLEVPPRGAGAGVIVDEEIINAEAAVAETPIEQAANEEYGIPQPDTQVWIPKWEYKGLQLPTVPAETNPRLNGFINKDLPFRKRRFE